MSWREKLVVRILFLIAQIVAAGDQGFDPRLSAEIKNIASHVQVSRIGEDKPA